MDLSLILTGVLGSDYWLLASFLKQYVYISVYTTYIN